MFVQMTFNLAFGLYNKAKTRPITGCSSKDTDGERAAVPQRIQQARPRIQLFQPRLAPREVISFLTRGLQQHVSRCGRSRDERLAVVEGLGGNFARMVHTHERC